MSECKSITQTVKEEDDVVAAARKILRALGMNENLTDDTRMILEELDTRLSTMALHSENKVGEISEIKKRLNHVQEKVASWESDQSMIWDSGPEAASEYLQAVDEVRRLIEILGSLSLNEDGEEGKLLLQAHDVLQKAMARLEDEFCHILVQHMQAFEPELMSFRSCEDVLDGDSILSVEDDSLEETLNRDNSSKGSEEFIRDLIHPNVIPDLKRIANAMFNSNYDQECCQAYVFTRKDALDECLSLLEMEKMSIEELLKMDWSSLDPKIKKWMRAIKIFIQVYLASEKWLCDQIFGEFGSFSSTCFVEISKASVLQLMNFCEAIVIGDRQPDKLYRILDMYETLAELLPDIDSLYSGEAGSSVRIECDEVLKRLGDSVRGNFYEFENAVRSNRSTNPFAGGGVHHLTKYVMNYINILTDYSDILNFLLKDHGCDDPFSLFPNVNPVEEEEKEVASSSYSVTPLAHHLRSITSILESNLDSKSRLYRDVSLQHFFLMNNMCYMVQKVKDSELRAFFGDNWIRQNMRKFQRHAYKYERAAWSSILSLMKDDGLCNPGSSSVSKTLLKERIRSFNLAFEEIYKSQTGWLISDPQLREDLRISVSLIVIQAYRMFIGRNIIHLDGGKHSEKYIKHSAEDLQDYLLDLFEGSPRSLSYPGRR